MTRGQRFPAESRWTVDARTGVRVRQVTAAPAIHQQPYFYISAYDDAMRWLVFASNRMGRPQIFAEDRATGELVQLTDRPDLNEGSIFPSHDGRHVYFTAGSGCWRVGTDTYAEEQLIDFRDLVPPGQRDKVRADGHMGMSHDDRWGVVSGTAGDDAYMIVVDNAAKRGEVIVQRESIGHHQFCPDDSTLIWYGVTLQDRVWLVNRDGTNNRRLYRRGPGQWITHETWLVGTREMALVDWPKGIIAVHADTGAVRRVTSFNAWHPSVNRRGTRMVADTNHPDIGLQIFDPRDGIGAPTTLCHPDASGLGDHWKGPFPYDHGPIPIYAPPQTHPHPSFSPDGRFVVFASDRTGRVETSQIYEAEVPPALRG